MQLLKSVDELQSFKRTILEYFVSSEEEAILGFLDKIQKMKENQPLPDLEVMPSFVKSLAVEEFITAVEFESEERNE
jgi:hypothetical protein